MLIEVSSLESWKFTISRHKNACCPVMYNMYNMQFAYRYHGPPKPTFLEVFMVNNLVFRWPKPLFSMVLGAHGICKKTVTFFWGMHVVSAENSAKLSISSPGASLIFGSLCRCMEQFLATKSAAVDSLLSF